MTKTERSFDYIEWKRKIYFQKIIIPAIAFSHNHLNNLEYF